MHNHTFDNNPYAMFAKNEYWPEKCVIINNIMNLERAVNGTTCTDNGTTCTDNGTSCTDNGTTCTDTRPCLDGRLFSTLLTIDWNGVQLIQLANFLLIISTVVSVRLRTHNDAFPKLPVHRRLSWIQRRSMIYNYYFVHLQLTALMTEAKAFFYLPETTKSKYPYRFENQYDRGGWCHLEQET